MCKNQYYYNNQTQKDEATEEFKKLVPVNLLAFGGGTVCVLAADVIRESILVVLDFDVILTESLATLFGLAGTKADQIRIDSAVVAASHVGSTSATLHFTIQTRSQELERKNLWSSNLPV